MTQVVKEGDLVESRLVFRFKDGFLHDEKVAFSQQRVFTLISYRLLQHGPSFLVEEAMSTVGKLLVYGLEGGFLFLVLFFFYWQVFGESASETS